MANYVSPNGHPIIGTKEQIPGVGLITGIEPDGTPIYGGATDIDWDDQKPVRDGEGKILFVDSQRRCWTFEQLTMVDDEE